MTSMVLKVVLKFRQLSGSFAVCRLPPDAVLPQIRPSAPLVSMTRTGDELSLVCPADQAPANATCEGPWTCFQLEGPFPFSQTGVLAAFLDPLAQHKIPIFAISTFDTDYILVKPEHAAKARDALQAAGHRWIT
jgi:uncharacterized protein